jgi:BirA family biotin operon repressor/biotin-[acetyl-CoA-carboxylase] ligase
MIIGSNIIFHEALASTNTEAASMLRNEEPPEGTVVHASFQTAGKGHAGNTWSSDEGSNLLFSVILYPQSLIPEDQFLLSMTISLGLCEFLDRHCSGSMVKWPNDIILNDRKIAGILIENSIMGTNIESSIAGIGLNLNQTFFKGVTPSPASLRSATGSEYDIQTCLKEVLTDIDIRYRQLLYGNRKQIRKDYLSRMWRMLEWHSFASGGNVFRGRIRDVMDHGHLAVEKEDGSIICYSFKEISYLF